MSALNPLLGQSKHITSDDLIMGFIGIHIIVN